MKAQPIKLRAWDEDGFMFIPTRIDFQENGDVVVWNKKDFGTLGSSVISLMRCVNEVDIAGVDIYEGDIVAYVNTSGQDGSADFAPVELEGYGCWILDNVLGGCLVVGNVFENKEILETFGPNMTNEKPTTQPLEAKRKFSISFRESQIVEMRDGGKKWKEIGEKHGITASRAYQIYMKALEKNRIK